MSDPTTIKEVVAELHLDDDQSGNYLRAEADTKTNDANTRQQSWCTAAAVTLAARAESGEPFTADDLRADGLGEPDKPSRWGGLFKHAAADGLIVSVGVINSRRAQRHGSLSRVWVGARGADIAA